jgi:hypothetical protein
MFEVVRIKNVDRSCVGTIDVLPDDMLLEIFESYLDEDSSEDKPMWLPLVQVCRRWRNLVFKSPYHLRLRLPCTPSNHFREMLDIWPSLPIVISDDGNTNPGVDNIIAALERNDRVCKIQLGGEPTSLLLRSVAATQKPFPLLTDLELRSDDEWGLALPDSFLGGSAPRLQSLRLEFIPFQGIRTLLSSATDLVHLDLWNIPDSGYISPETMATTLSPLTQLKTLALGFHARDSFRSPPVREFRNNPFLFSLVALPNLTHLWFHGTSVYFEVLVAHVDAPRLHSLKITFFNEPSFDISVLPQFIRRAEKFMSLEKASLCFSKDTVQLTLSPQMETYDDAVLSLGISCKEAYGPPTLSDVFRSSIPPLSSSKCLEIRVDRYQRSQWQYDMENVQWRELLRPFTAVEDLFISEELALRVAPALEEAARAERRLGARGVLPALRRLFFEGLQPSDSGPFREAIPQFVAARPVDVLCWKTKEGSIYTM